MLPCSVARLNIGIYFCYLVVLFGVTNKCLELILCSRKFVKLMISIIRTVRAYRVRVLAGDILLCSWARHLTLTVPLSTQVYKWILATLMMGGKLAMD